MKEYDATEQAYKNGYKQGVMDLAERVKKYYGNLKGENMGATIGFYVDIVSKEMTEEEE